MHKNGALLIPLCLVAVSLCSCQWDSVYSNRAFLSFKYKLEACADIKGQDPTREIWFSDYGGTDYSYLFDLSYENSYLDFRVAVIDGRAYGYGHLRLCWTNHAVFEDRDFSYAAINGGDYGGIITAENVPDAFEDWVYSIYWCRLNMQFILPDTQEAIILTFHFRGGEANPVPQEFLSRHAQ